MRAVFAVLLTIFLAGCYKPIYTQVNDSSIISNRPLSANIVGDKFGVIDIKREAMAPIRIKIEAIKAGCKTERARSLGSDFDGYILIEIRNGEKLLAKSQMDFKTEPGMDECKKVWDKLTRELRW